MTESITVPEPMVQVSLTLGEARALGGEAHCSPTAFSRARECLSAAIAEAEDRNRDEQLVEKVAKAMYGDPVEWGLDTYEAREWWRKLARAAIAAVEEARGNDA